MTINSYHTITDSKLQDKIEQHDTEEIVRKGFNSVVDKNMMFYVMVTDQDTEITYSKPGLLTRAKKYVFGEEDEYRIDYAEERIYEFTGKMAEALDIDFNEAVEFLIMVGLIEHYNENNISDSDMEEISDRANELRQEYNEEMGATANIAVVADLKTEDEMDVEASKGQFESDLQKAEQ